VEDGLVLFKVERHNINIDGTPHLQDVALVIAGVASGVLLAKAGTLFNPRAKKT
jgi:hypothetical protein